MNKLSLVPGDLLTQHLLIDVLTKMFLNSITTERAAATSEFPRPNVATAGTQSAQTDAQFDSTIVTISGQNNERVVAVTQMSEMP